jgi:Tfp pilus assembly protein PilN
MAKRIINLKMQCLSLCIAFIQSGVIANAQTSPSLMTQRIQSADELLNDIQHFKIQARQLHMHAQSLIAQATRLKGEASQFEIKAPAINSHTQMNSIQLAAAKQQYNNDINEFAEHAKAYNQHVIDFQKLVGECHASNEAVANILQKYELHVTQFHIPMPNIRPPHICLGLQAQMGDMSGIARRMMGDQIRVIQSEAQLNHEKTGMQMADTAAVNLQTKAMLNAQRAKGEAQLVGEYGRLKEEYDLLKTEKDTIDGVKIVNAKMMQTTVSGKVVRKL